MPPVSIALISNTTSRFCSRERFTTTNVQLQGDDFLVNSQALQASLSRHNLQKIPKLAANYMGTRVMLGENTHIECLLNLQDFARLAEPVFAQRLGPSLKLVHLTGRTVEVAFL